MKRKYIIVLLWCLWFCSLIVCAIFSNNYINNKRNELRDEFQNNLESLFDGQNWLNNRWGDEYDGFFEDIFCGKPVRNYKKIGIPVKPINYENFMQDAFDGIPSYLESTIDRLQHDYLEWEKNYGKVDSLYELNWRDEYPNEKNEGWCLMRTHYRGTPDDILQANSIFPYKVGLKKVKGGNPYSVEEAVNEAFEFYTTSEQSILNGRYSSYLHFWPLIYKCNNKYYSIMENVDYDASKTATPAIDFSRKEKRYLNEDKEAFEYLEVQNSFYIVFIAATQETHYMMYERKEAILKDKIDLILLFGVGLSLLFFSAIIPLTKQEKKSKAKE